MMIITIIVVMVMISKMIITAGLMTMISMMIIRAALMTMAISRALG